MEKPTLEIRRRLLGSRSIARHGRATPQLKTARANLHGWLGYLAEDGWALAQRISQGRAPDAENAVRAACAAHDRACEAMGLPGVPACPGPLRP